MNGSRGRRGALPAVMVALLAGCIALWWLAREDGKDRLAREAARAPAAAEEAPVLPPAPPAVPPGEVGPLAAAEAPPPVVAAPPEAAARDEHEASHVRWFRLRVVDGYGEGVPQADVEVWPHGELVGYENAATKDGPAHLVEPERHRTDAAGEAAFPADAHLVLRASKPAVGVSKIVAAPLGSLESSAQFMFFRETSAAGTTADPILMTAVLFPAAVVEGGVLEPEEAGTPGEAGVPNVAVFMQAFQGPSVAEPGIPRGPPRAVGVSDSEGRYSLGLGLEEASPVKLWAARGRRVSLASLRRLEPGARHAVDLRFPGGFVIEGRVAGFSGDVGQARIWASELGEHLRIDGLFDSGGPFEIELARPGRYAVHMTAAGLVQAEPLLVELTEAEPVAAVELRLLSAALVPGFVRAEDGSPIRGARVRLVHDGAGDVHAPRLRAGTNGDGWFTLGPVHPGREHVLQVSAKGCAPDTIGGVRAGVEPNLLVLRRHPTASVTGQVTDAATGLPVEEFVLVTRWSAPRHVLDRMGRFRVEEVPGGEERVLTVKAEGYAPAHGPPFRVTGGELRMDFQLGRMASLEVTAMDAAGRPVPGAELTLVEADALSPVLAGEPRRRRTDARGRTRFGDVAPGRAWLAGAAGALAAGPVAVDVPSGGSVEHALALAPAVAAERGSVVVSLLRVAAPGVPVVVTLLPFSPGSGGAPPAALVQQDATGLSTVRFGGVPPGLYRVLVHVDGEPADQSTVLVGPAAHVATELDPQGSLEASAQHVADVLSEFGYL